ncbi:MAG TPA: site-specific integrase [Urbifossiella sp.]|nr:site-specific integrase [Urbifossiella sp.]
MSRPARPWHRKQTGWWMVEIGGKQEKLVEGPKDEKHRVLAEEKFVELRKLRRMAPEEVGSRTADLIEAFLRHSRLHFAADTHRMNKYYLQILAEACGQVPAREIKPLHVQRMIDDRVDPERKRERNEKAWGETTVYNARKAAFRVFSWAAEQKIIPDNPLAGMKRPKPKPRQRAITDAEFWQLYGNAGGPLRDLLLALYLSGARPKEVRELTWDKVGEDRWTLPEHKTAKKTGKPRVIFLPKELIELMGRLRAERQTGHVFLNTEGQPWTMDALRQQVARIRAKLGMSKDVTAYLCRHGFGTRAILSGVDGQTLAELMGHTSQEMISKVYVHLADQHQHLKDAVNKINGASMPSQALPRSTRKRAIPVNPKKPGPKRKDAAPTP